MSANAIETLRGCVESCAAESGAEHEGVGEDALAAVEALLEATNNYLRKISDPMCPPAIRQIAVDALDDAVRRVESGQ